MEELRERWLEFKSRVSFYGVYKKAMKPLSYFQLVRTANIIPKEYLSLDLFLYTEKQIFNFLSSFF